MAGALAARYSCARSTARILVRGRRVYPSNTKHFRSPNVSKTVFPVLWAASFCHMLNDMMQALLPAVYPILRGDLDLSFAQVGFLTFVYQLTASLFSHSLATTPTAADAVLLAVRHGVVDGRAADDRFCGPLWRAARRRDAARASAPRSSIRNPRASPGSLPADRMVSPSPCFRSAAISARRSGRWPPRSSCCRADRPGWPGSRSRRWPASSS